MSLNKKELNFYKKNGYLVKEKLISNKEITKINSLIKKILKREETKTTKIKNLGGTFENKNDFVYNSNSSKNREILRLNNPTYFTSFF